MLIALIPHIVRRPEITAENLRGIAAGSDQMVRLRYAEPKVEQEPVSAPAAKKSKPAPTASNRPKAMLACPDCGGTVEHMEGCMLCPACGYSKCG